MTIRFKIWALLVCVLTLLMSLCVQSVSASDGLTLTVSTVNAEPGTEVEVPIILSGNDMGLAGFMVSVNHDSNLSLKSITKGSALGTLTYTKPGDLTSNPLNIGFDGQDADYSNGTVATFTYVVPADAEGFYEVNASYSAGNIFDGDLNNVDIKIINGGIVVNSTPEVIEPVISYSNFEKGTKNIRLDVNLDSPDEITGKVYVALYDEKGHTVKTKVYPAAETVNAMLDSVDGKYIKIMWWDNEYRPIVENLKIDL